MMKVVLIVCMCMAAAANECTEPGTISKEGAATLLPGNYNEDESIVDKDFFKYRVTKNGCNNLDYRGRVAVYCDGAKTCQPLGEDDACGDGAAPCKSGQSCIAGWCWDDDEIKKTLKCSSDENCAKYNLVCTKDTGVCNDLNGCLSDQDCNSIGKTTCNRKPGLGNWKCV